MQSLGVALLISIYATVLIGLIILVNCFILQPFVDLKMRHFILPNFVEP